MVAYHDKEWGVPCHDDQKLFELLTLEGAQAGLSWSTILNKREGYREAFANFEVEKVAKFTKRHVQRLLKEPTIVRNRLKVEGTVKNAKAFLQVVEDEGSFDAYIWQFVKGEPKINKRRSLKRIPAETKESQKMSKALKKRGFTFVGPTICYAFMQAAGLVNDHLTTCFRYQKLM